MKNFIFFIFLLAINFPINATTTLYKNINGYTLNKSGQLIHFTALQFTNNKIDRLFKKIDKLPEQGVHIIDGQGKTLLPGLIDSHGHVLSYGLSLMQVDLNGVASEQAAVKQAIAFRANGFKLNRFKANG